MDDILTPPERVADSPARAPREGVGLCLSGGGYRAMLFHVGALWRLNELGWLPRLSFVSSVSGGSITAGVLAAKWRDLGFGNDGVAMNFADQIAQPLQELADHTIDIPSVLTGILTPRTTVGDRTTASLRHHLFGAATLADLPDSPRFILTATNLDKAVEIRNDLMHFTTDDVDPAQYDAVEGLLEMLRTVDPRQ